jgi:ribose transport system substrate-binding protein
MVLMGVLAAMGTATAVAQNLTIAWVHSNASAQSEQRSLEGFRNHLEQTGWGWQLSTLDSRGSGELTASNIQDAVERGVDAVIVSMADLRASRAALTAASNAGVPVFAVDSGWVDGVVVDITTNNWEMSSKISIYLIDRLGGQGNIVFLRMAEHHGTRKRGDVMETMLREFPDVNVLVEHNIDYTAFFEDTTRVMEDFVARFGDTIDAVWAPWDEPAQAAANVLIANGYDRDDLIVTGIDGHPQAIDYIREAGNPFVATVAQPFELMGSTIADYIHAMLVEGRPAEEVIPSTTVYLNAPLITPANLPAPDRYPWEVD